MTKDYNFKKITNEQLDRFSIIDERGEDAEFDAFMDDQADIISALRDGVGDVAEACWDELKRRQDEVDAAAEDPYENLRIELRIAAKAAYLDGATQAQINYIISLAEEAEKPNLGITGRLTKMEACLIIDDLKK